MMKINQNISIFNTKNMTISTLKNHVLKKIDEIFKETKKRLVFLTFQIFMMKINQNISFFDTKNMTTSTLKKS